MKKTLALVLVAVIACLTLVSCNTLDKVMDMISGKTESAADLWDSATYNSDAEFGEGDKTVEVEVRVEDKSVTFTIHTDADTLGDALLENGLIVGENGAYGLYVKTVNGMLADYDIDGSYWSFYENGEMMMTGVDGEFIFGGEHYEIIYAK